MAEVRAVRRSKGSVVAVGEEEIAPLSQHSAAWGYWSNHCRDRRCRTNTASPQRHDPTDQTTIVVPTGTGLRRQVRIGIFPVSGLGAGDGSPSNPLTIIKLLPRVGGI
jgi:hypothetical protein